MWFRIEGDRPKAIRVLRHGRDAGMWVGGGTIHPPCGRF